MRSLIITIGICIVAPPARGADKPWIAAVLQVGQYAEFEYRSDVDRERPFFIHYVSTRLGSQKVTEMDSFDIVLKDPQRGISAIPIHRIHGIEFGPRDHVDVLSVEKKNRVGLARHFHEEMRVNIKQHVTLGEFSTDFRTIVPYVFVIGDRPADLYAKDERTKTSYEQWVVTSVQNDFLLLTGPMIRVLRSPDKEESAGRQVVIPIAAIGIVSIPGKAQARH